MARLSHSNKVKVGIGAAVIAMLLLAPFVLTFTGIHLPGQSFSAFSLQSCSSNTERTTKAQEQDASYTLDEVKSLDVSWVGMNLEVTESEDELIHVHESIEAGVPVDYDELATLEVNNGALSITSPNVRQSINLTGDLDSKTLTIAVPKGLATGTAETHGDAEEGMNAASGTVTSPSLDTVELDGVCKSINVTGMSATAFTVNATCDDVALNNVSVGDLNLSGVCDSFNVTNVCAETLSLESTCDDIMLDGIEVNDLTLSAVCSDITMNGEVRDTFTHDGTSDSVDCTFTGTAPQNIALAGVTDSVSFTLPAGTGFTATSDALSGVGLDNPIDTDLPLTHRGDAWIYGDGAVAINISAVYDDLNISEA